jgi:ABC-type sugar transport system substrate-binding protein
MMAGVLQAMQEAGLDPSKYWLGSSNGKEKSWKWVQDGTTTMDVNETATLEADIAFQQMKAHFAGKPFKKAVYVYVTPFEKENIKVDSLVPFFHDDYMKKRDAKAFVFDLNNAVFKENPSYK